MRKKTEKPIQRTTKKGLLAAKTPLDRQTDQIFGMTLIKGIYMSLVFIPAAHKFRASGKGRWWLLFALRREKKGIWYVDVVIGSSIWLAYIANDLVSLSNSAQIHGYELLRKGF